MDESNNTDYESGGGRKQPPGKGRKWALRIGTLIILVLLLLVILHQCGVFRYPWESYPAGNVGGSIKQGTPGVSVEDMLAAMQERADKSKIHLKINARPTFANGEADGNLYIVNPVDNAFNMKAEIRLDDTDELVYESGLMAPNQYIDNDKLSKVLPKGEYTATASIFAYDLENPDKQVNQASASLIITIEN